MKLIGHLFVSFFPHTQDGEYISPFLKPAEWGIKEIHICSAQILPKSLAYFSLTPPLNSIPIGFFVFPRPSYPKPPIEKQENPNSHLASCGVSPPLRKGERDDWGGRGKTFPFPLILCLPIPDA